MGVVHRLCCLLLVGVRGGVLGGTLRVGVVCWVVVVYQRRVRHLVICMGDEDIGMAGERWIWLIWVGRAATGNTLWVMWSLKPLLDNSMTLKAGKS